MIIDFHNHIGRKKGLEFTAEQLLEKMDASNIDKAVIFSFPENINNDYIVESCEKYPDRFIGFVTVNPWDENDQEVLEYYLGEKHLKGIKLHPLRHGYSFDNHLLLDPIFKIAEKYDVPIIAYGAANVLSVSNMFEEMANTFPKVKLIMAHSGQMYEAKPAISAASRTPNLYLESSRIFALNVRKSIADVRLEQLLMGTDMPYGDYDLELMKIKGECPDEKTFEAYVGGNAIKLLGGKI